MKIMGIDSSSKKTGIAIYNNNHLAEHFLLDYSKIRDYDRRFPQMVQDIEKHITDLAPDVVYVEDTWEKNQGFNNVATLKKLSYILGAIRHICLTHKIPFNLIFPSEWRSTIGMQTGKLNREELKQLSKDYVDEKYGAKVNDDVADAICIAEAGNIINERIFGDFSN